MAGRGLYAAAEPTISKVTAEANHLRVAAEPRLAELVDHVERVRAAAEPTVRRVSHDITRFRAAAEPKVLVAAERAEQTRAAAQPALDRADEIAGRVRKWTQANGPAIADVIVGVRYFAAHAHVENWEDLEPVDWEKAIELMRADDGVPLAWIPPSYIVKALVDADNHAARDAVLLAHSDEIAKACRDVVENVTIDRLNDLRGMLDEAWAAYDAGLFGPAQAGAAAAVGEVINEYLDDQFIGREFREFRERLKQYRDAAPETWAVTEVRMTAVLCGVSTAAQNTRFGHPGFNRMRARMERRRPPTGQPIACAGSCSPRPPRASCNSGSPTSGCSPPVGVRSRPPPSPRPGTAPPESPRHLSLNLSRSAD